ncbi:MAG: 4Fe-4S binding protein [Candidatus Omnitrophota bacterium]
MKRLIIKIDENKCNGCGACITDCHEGALEIVNGKAKLVKESLCDGLGACMGTCPAGALTIEERDVDAFDEHEARMTEGHAHHAHQPHVCPGSMMKEWNKGTGSEVAAIKGSSALRQWPVELKLLNPSAPYFKNADLLVCADCVPFAFANFHERFLKGKALVVFCPKLDQAADAYIEKMTAIVRENDIRSITPVRMEVPCCAGTTAIVEQAVKNSGKNVLIKEYTISLSGEIV